MIVSLQSAITIAVFDFSRKNNVRCAESQVILIYLRKGEVASRDFSLVLDCLILVVYSILSLVLHPRQMNMSFR